MTVIALNCVGLCPAVLALKGIHITDRNFRNLLLSGNQVEEIKSELTRNKGETDASDNYSRSSLNGRFCKRTALLTAALFETQEN